MGRIGRPPVVVAPEDAREMFRLFAAGDSTDHIGKVCGYDPRVVQRTLRAELGPLIAARKLLRTQKQRAAELGFNETSLEYREGFEAGYHMAVTHIKLHGLEAMRAYCNGRLLPWRDHGRYTPPAFSE